MAKKLPVPVALPISVVVLLILGLIAGPIIKSTASEEQLATNVLLSAIPFILIFAAIILAFISLIVLASNLLSHKIPERIYRPIERIVIAGIVLGVIGMFQPWSFALYRIGFFMVLIFWLCFVLWNHVKPKGEEIAQENQVTATSQA
jgi:Na+-translocating ferredoxin:NAD+ oxidoreductase RnfE subunit